jgi:ABC-type branched-subunit amino acid transport system substrate-binding protein
MRGRRWIVLAVTLALVAVACGERGDDPSVAAGGGDTGAGTTESTGEASGDEGGEGDFGTLEGVCGPNEGGGAVPDAPSEEILGVSEDSISIGTVADPGFDARPGLNQELHDAATAFAAWCNEAGGINGKQIDLTLYDAAFSNYQPEVEMACENEFALVGSGALQDNLWPDVGPPCGLIDIAGFSVTPEKAGVAGQDPVEKRTVQPLPNPSDELAVAGSLLLQEEFPEAADRTGVLWSDFPTLVVQAERITEGWEAVGHEIVHTDIYNSLGEANWTPFATAIQAADVQFLNFIGEGENMARLQQALQEVGYEPEVTYQEVNFYDQQYVDAAAGAAEGTFIRLTIWPFEEADENPATRQYIDNVEAIDGKVAGLGVQATSAWLLFAEVAAECDRDDDLTRSCVLEGAASTTEWDGAGLHIEASPGTNEGGSCVIVMRVEDGSFVRHAPTDEGYFCPDDSVVELTDVTGISG